MAHEGRTCATGALAFRTKGNAPRRVVVELGPHPKTTLRSRSGKYADATNSRLDQSIQMQLDERAARIKKVEASISSK